MSDLQAPPNYSVIVVHTDDGNGPTACAGQPIRLFGQYRTPNMSGSVGDVSGVRQGERVEEEE